MGFESTSPERDWNSHVISLEFCDDEEAYYSMRRTANAARHVRPDARLSIMASKSKPIGSS